MNGFIKRLKFIFEYIVNLPLLQAGIGISIGVILGMEILRDDRQVKFMLVSLIIGVGFSFIARVTSEKQIKRKIFSALCILFLFVLVGLYRVRCTYGEVFLDKVNRAYTTEVEQLEVISDGQKNGQNKVFTTKINNDSKKKSPGKVQIKLPRDTEVRYGDVIKGSFELQEPKNPDGFDYKFYLNTQGIFYTSRSSSFEIISRKSTVQGVFSRIRVAASSRIRSVLPEPHASLVAGLLWGERANMPETFKNNLSKTGTTHIIAVSGFNVSMLVLIMLKSAGIIPRKTAVLFTALGLLAFLALVGFDNSPAMRAGIMGFIVLLSKVFGRQVSFLSLISIPLIFLLVINPLTLYTVSFQLSFTALVGIVVFAKPIMYHLYIIPGVVREEAATTIAAIIATSPVTIVNFQSFSLVALFVNLLVLPVIALISLLGFINLLAALASISLGQWVSFFVIPVMNYLIWIINSFGSLPFANVTLPSLSQYFVPLAYCLMSLIIIELHYRNKYYFKTQNVRKSV